MGPGLTGIMADLNPNPNFEAHSNRDDPIALSDEIVGSKWVLQRDYRCAIADSISVREPAAHHRIETAIP